MKRGALIYQQISAIAVTLLIVMAGLHSGIILVNGKQNVTQQQIIVDGDADGDNDFATIQAAINNASEGSTILVQSGTYNETVVINKSLTLVGDPGNTTVGPGSNAPILNGGGREGSAFTIASGVSDVVIKGFIIRNFTGTFPNGVGVVATDNSNSNITIRDNRFRHLITGGVISLPGGQQWTIKKNRIVGAGIHGIYLANTAASVVVNNTIIGKGNVFSAESGSIYGITIVSSSPTTDALTSITIKDNTLSGAFEGLGIINIWSIATHENETLHSIRIINNSIHERTPSDAITRGINIFANGESGNKAVITNLTVTNNSISGVSAAAIGIGGRGANISSIQNITLQNNIINATESGIVLTGHDRNTIKRITIKHNRIHHSDAHSLSIISLGNSTISDISVYNNTITNAGLRGISIRSTHFSQIEMLRIAGNKIKNSTKIGFNIVSFRNSSITNIYLQNNIIVKSGNWGVKIQASETAVVANITLQRNRIRANDGGIHIGSEVQVKTLTITWNAIVNNSGYGLLNKNSSTVNATFNWWGASSGPGGNVTDPITDVLANGDGDQISTNIHFDPWLTLPPSQVPPPVVGSNRPTDPDTDGKFEDINGDGTVNVVDVQALFANLRSSAIQNNKRAFDFNGDGSVNVVDVQWLFVHEV
ncbi:MAG: right-handed parallel beta-helix repeat-containing protein [Halobacteriaceae archaeon]